MRTKQIIALLLVVISVLAPLSSIATTKSNVQAVFSIEINPYSAEEVDRYIKEYNLMPETALALKKYSEECIAGKVNAPTSIKASGITPMALVSSRYYTGYNNKRYYEEVMSLRNTSSAEILYQGNTFGTYVNRVITALAGFIVDGALNTATGGKWSIVTILGSGTPSGVPANANFRHEARLVETKTQIFTYIESESGGGIYDFGSRVERSSYYFSNEAIFPGYTPRRTGNTITMVAQATGYTNPDYHAYYGYAMGGYIGSVDYFDYGGVTYDSIG